MYSVVDKMMRCNQFAPVKHADTKRHWKTDTYRQRELNYCVGVNVGTLDKVVVASFGIRADIGPLLLQLLACLRCLLSADTLISRQTSDTLLSDD